MVAAGPAFQFEAVSWLKSQNVLPIRDTPLNAAGEAAPDDDIILRHAGLDDALVAFAAFEASRPRRVVGSIEVGGVGDHGCEEVRHLSGGAPFGRDRTLGVQVVGQVDHVHGRECFPKR